MLTDKRQYSLRCFVFEYGDIYQSENKAEKEYSKTVHIYITRGMRIFAVDKTYDY